MSKRRERKASAIQAAIRGVLFGRWDPLQLNDNPLLADEYDSYIAPVYRILIGSRSLEELVRFLGEAEAATGVVTHSPEGLCSIAAELLDLEVKL